MESHESHVPSHSCMDTTMVVQGPASRHDSKASYSCLCKVAWHCWHRKCWGIQGRDLKKLQSPLENAPSMDDLYLYLPIKHADVQELRYICEITMTCYVILGELP